MAGGAVPADAYAGALAAPLIPWLRQLAPAAHLCCFGLYAPANAELLRRLGVQTLLGGKFEGELTRLYRAPDRAGLDRRAIFAQVWALAGGEALAGDAVWDAPRALVSAMSEPWYC